MSTENRAENKVKLESSDGEFFEVDELVAIESETVKEMMDMLGESVREGAIRSPNVCSKSLAKVIEYCRYHVESQKSSNETPKVPENKVKQWDTEFVKVDMTTLFDLIMTASFLNIKKLLDLACHAVAEDIKSKDVEEIRKIFNIKNDLTPEEEEQVKKENQWAFYLSMDWTAGPILLDV